MPETTIHEPSAPKAQSFLDHECSLPAGTCHMGEPPREVAMAHTAATSRQELYTTEQVASWRKFNGAMRSRGERMFVQLWYVGSHTSLCSDAEAGSLVNEVRHAAAQAVDAGFDGVELRVGHGLKLEQYLQAVGARPEVAGDSALSLRARLLISVVMAVAQEIGADRTRVCATSLPSGDSQVRYSFIVGRLGVAYLREAGHCMRNPPCHVAHVGSTVLSAAVKAPAPTNPTAHRYRPVLSGALDRRRLPA